MTAGARKSLGLALASLAVPMLANSAELNLPREGWASWEVPAAENAPFACCWKHWDGRPATPESCDLDGDRGGYRTRDDGPTDRIKVYAKFRDGELAGLQALAAACPVKTQTAVQELGVVPGDDSVRWLVSQVKREGTGARRPESLQEHALAAISMHGDARAGTELSELARAHGNAGLRRKALFWLAHAGSAGAEAVIAQAIRKDSSAEVSEQAVFALSQLPEERATRALIATAEDVSLTREQRKRAVFWLAHSDSDSAQSYLERVLARISPSP